MDKKILTIMASLVIIAVVVVGVVMVAAGGARSAGGFTKLFNELENPSGVSYSQYLELPNDWAVNDVKKVSDRIVDMYVHSAIVYETTTVYFTVLYFTYMSDQWADPDQGTVFHVPTTVEHDNYLDINHGQFHLSVSSATDLSANYDIGDVITLETTLAINDEGDLAFSSWSVSGTI